MKIALDYDGTYTADPALWDAFIKGALANGHKIVCVTMRFESEPILLSIPVIYTGRKAKGKFAASLGEMFDIWIDDRPFWILNDAVL